MPDPVVNIDAARKAGIPEDVILQTLQSKFGKDIADPIQRGQKAGLPLNTINDTIAAHYNNPQPNWMDKAASKINSVSDRAIDFVRPIADSAATMIGAGATPELLGAGGLAAGAGVDALLQKMQSPEAQKRNQTMLSKGLGATPGSIGDTAANAVQNEGVNELLGKLGTMAIGKVKSLLTPVQPELRKLGATFSQYAKEPGTLSSLLENVWGHSAKQEAMQNSAQAARSEFGNILANPETASKVANPGDRFNIGKLNQSYSVNRGTAESLGRVNAQEVPQAFTKQFAWQQGPPPVTVEGPINISNTAKEAQDYLTNIQKTYGDKPLSDVDQKLVKTAKGILESSANGTKSIPFRDAMDFLHGPNGDSGLEKMSNLKPGELDTSKSSLSGFGDALHRDISNSIGQWQSGAPQALESYNAARSAALTKQTLAEGGNLSDLVGKVQGSIPLIDKALSNPQQTQKLLNTSNLAGLPSTNMRQDLAGYRLQQIWSKADSGSGTLNGEALVKEWNNPAFEATKDKLYSKPTQEQIGKFFDNVAKVSGTGPQGSYGMARLTYQGIAIPAAFIMGSATGHGLLSFAAAELPPTVIGRLMSKPMVAQVMQRMVTNQPLEMSTQAAGRLIMGALNGSTVLLKSGDGKEVPAKVRDGKISQ